MPDALPVIFSTHELHSRAAALLARAGTLQIAGSLDAASLVDECRGASIVIVRAPLPEALFGEAPKLRAAIRHGTGLDMIPVEAATRAGVLVANVPGANASTVAEHVFFVTQALLRRFRIVDRDLRTSGWLAARDHANSTGELRGRTIGIVGMGNIGKEVFRVARHGYGLKVLASSRNRDSLPEGALYASVDKLVEESDVIVLCCALTQETKGLLNRDRIGRMRAGAVLVNVSRGPVVDDDALIDALKAGRIGGAALDVFAVQPLPSGHPYFGFDNVIVTPHMAGITEESMLRMGMGAAGEAIRILDGKLPVNLRNPEAVARYRERFADSRQGGMGESDLPAVRT